MKVYIYTTDKEINFQNLLIRFLFMFVATNSSAVIWVPKENCSQGVLQWYERVALRGQQKQQLEDGKHYCKYERGAGQ